MSLWSRFKKFIEEFFEDEPDEKPLGPGFKTRREPEPVRETAKKSDTAKPSDIEIIELYEDEYEAVSDYFPDKLSEGQLKSAYKLIDRMQKEGWEWDDIVDEIINDFWDWFRENY